MDNIVKIFACASAFYRETVRSVRSLCVSPYLKEGSIVDLLVIFLPLFSFYSVAILKPLRNYLIYIR